MNNLKKPNKPKIGAVLYIVNIGNELRRGTKQVISPVTVSKVGRKYFEVTSTRYHGTDTKFDIDTWGQVSDYCSNWHLYASEKEWLDQVESTDLTDNIRKFFNTWGADKLTLESLRIIHAEITKPT